MRIGFGPRGQGSFFIFGREPGGSVHAGRDYELRDLNKFFLRSHPSWAGDSYEMCA